MVDKHTHNELRNSFPTQQCHYFSEKTTKISNSKGIQVLGTSTLLITFIREKISVAMVMIQFYFLFINSVPQLVFLQSHQPFCYLPISSKNSIRQARVYLLYIHHRAGIKGDPDNEVPVSGSWGHAHPVGDTHTVMAEHVSDYYKQLAREIHLQKRIVNSTKGEVQGIVKRKRYLLTSFVFNKFLQKSYN